MSNEHNEQQYPFLSDAIYDAVNSAIGEQGSAGRHITRKEATQVSKALIEKVTKELFKSHRVLFPQLGTLILKDTAARKGRNPRTGEEINIKERKTIKFNASSKIKETLK